MTVSSRRPEHPNHVWSYDFVQNRTHNGKSFRMLKVIDEFTRECLAIRIGRKLDGSINVPLRLDLAEFDSAELVLTP